MSRRATWFKDYLEIPFPDCDSFSVDETIMRPLLGNDISLINRLQEIGRLVDGQATKLFEDPILLRDISFFKLVCYMTLVFHSTRWSVDLIEAAIERLVEVTQHPIFKKRLLYTIMGYSRLATNRSRSKDHGGIAFKVPPRHDPRSSRNLR